MSNLTVSQLNRAIKEGIPTRLADGNGLQFTLPKKGEAYWVYRYTDMHGKRKEMTIGKYSLMPLVEARFKASTLKLSQHQGADPLLEKRRAEYVKINCCDALFKDLVVNNFKTRPDSPKKSKPCFLAGFAINLCRQFAR